MPINFRFRDSQDILANRPNANPFSQLFWATDTNDYFRSDGQSWHDLLTGDNLGLIIVHGTNSASDNAVFASAVSAAAAAGTAVWITGTVRITTNQVVPSSATLAFIGGKLKPDNGVSVTLNTASLLASESQIFDCSVGGIITGPLIANWWARWFGAKGDDSTDDTGALIAWLATATASNVGANAILGGGIFRYGSALSAGASGTQIMILGTPNSAVRGGSTPTASVLRQTGGPTAFLTLNGFCGAIGVGFDNFGTATTALKFDVNSTRQTLDEFSFLVPSGANAWTDAAVRYETLGYAGIGRGEFGSAPALNLTNLGGTDLHVGVGNGATVFDCTSGSGVVVKCDCKANIIEFTEQVTYNSEANTQFWDNSATAQTITRLDFRGEFDSNVQTELNPIMNVKNVDCLNLFAPNIHSFGNLTNPFCRVTNTQVHIWGVTGSSLGQSVVAATDTASGIYQHSASKLNPANTKGVYDGTGSSAFTGSYIPVTVSTGNTARIHLERGSPEANTLYDITVPSTSDFSVVVAGPTDSSDQGSTVWGMPFRIRVKPAAALGVVTFSTGQWIMRSTSPLTNRMSVNFINQGTLNEELSRST